MLLLLASGLTLPTPPADAALAASSALAASATVATAVAPVARFRFGGGTLGQPIPAPANKGDDPDVVASVVTQNRGRALAVLSRPGQGNAVDFPSFAAVANDRLAAVRVTDTDLADGDALAPGLATFTLIGDFRLDPGGPADDGNNLVQRGLHGSSHQYKVQVDVVRGRARPSCAVGQAVDGVWESSTVVASRVVARETWYQVRCRRTEHALVLIVHAVGADGSLSVWSRDQLTGVPTYDLTWAGSPEVPMTIGGKLWPTGEFDPDDDQFSGVVDNVALRLS